MFEPSAPSTSRWALLTGTALLASALLRRRRRVVVAP
jgi:MYXO-CTERM domain-containing protein